MAGKVGRTGPRFMAEPDRLDAVVTGPGLGAAEATALREGRARAETAGEEAA